MANTRRVTVDRENVALRNFLMKDGVYDDMCIVADHNKRNASLHLITLIEEDIANHPELFKKKKTKK